MVGFLDAIFGGGAEKEAANKDILQGQMYQGQALPALASAYGTGTQAINQGVGAYAPLAQLGQTYSGGAGRYMGAIGAGTPAQQAAAQTAFQNSPGYQEMLKAAQDASARGFSTANMSGSGNAIIDQIMKSSGITSNAYQQYINNLQQAGQMGLGATGAAAQGQAGQYDTLANLAQNYGQNQADIYGNVMNTNIGANNLQAAGEAAGAKNLLNFGMNAASLALGMPGMGGGGGGGSALGGGGQQPWSFTNTPLGSLFRTS